MKTKQIVFTDIGVAELIETEVKEPKENEIVVETEFSSISCGTEKANISGNPNVGIGPLDEKNPVIFPRYAGYSSSGTVIKTGSSVTHIKAGDRVAMCWSQHKKINVITASNTIKLESDKISMKEAALFNIATFPLAAIRKTKVELGESMLIMGLGILGLFAVQFARAAGAVPVIAVDPVAERREKALECGADYALDPTSPNFVKTVKALTNGGASTAIEVTGLGIGLDQCLDCMARFGRVALLGCTRDKNFTIDYYRKVHGPGVQLIGAHTMARPKLESHPGYFTQADDLISVMKLCESRRIQLEETIDEIFRPEDCTKVYTRLINDRHFPVVSQFDWSNIE